jgi:hypothetical protein
MVVAPGRPKAEKPTDPHPAPRTEACMKEACSRALPDVGIDQKIGQGDWKQILRYTAEQRRRPDISISTDSCLNDVKRPGYFSSLEVNDLPSCRHCGVHPVAAWQPDGLRSAAEDCSSESLCCLRLATLAGPGSGLESDRSSSSSSRQSSTAPNERSSLNHRGPPHLPRQPGHPARLRCHGHHRLEPERPHTASATSTGSIRECSPEFRVDSEGIGSYRFLP